MSNYVVYHLHSDYSILDSTTKFKDYIKKAKELEMKAIGFSEHGNVYNWIKKKQECEKNGIKYLHGVEVYLTKTLNEKIRDNYHTVLYAKNYEGVMELNKLITISNDSNHFYYKPRLSFDEFLNISDNIISTSACLGSPLNNLKEIEGEYFEKLINKYDFLEIQPHANSKEQIEYNRFLYEMSKKYNKKLILGTDTHELNTYKQECRAILKKAKSIQNENEDNFNLTFRSYDELIDECKRQNAFSLDVYIEAINNTNVLADMIEDFELDNSFKYPDLYENEEKMFIDIVKKKLKEKIDIGAIDKNKINEYRKRLNEEFVAFKKQNMFSYMLFVYELIDWCWKNDIPTGISRGSVGGSVTAYIMGITDIDPVVWGTIFSRFVNEERISLADIDIDFAPDDREKVYNYIINKFGENKTSYIVTFNSISEKGTISEITRALGYDFKTSMDIKKEFEEDKEACIKKYKDIFYYYDGLLDTYISVGIHPAGIIASPITLNDNIGLFIQDGKIISQCDMKAVDSLNYVKFDILGLKNVSIIKETYKLLGVNYKKSHEINWNDENVYNDMLTSPAGIFQFESQYAFNMLCEFKPKTINDLSIVNASMRPSGASYRDKIFKREFHKNPTEEIDELLKDNYGYLIYQEDTIKFLQQICGLSGAQADTVRRAIGKKDVELLNKMLPKVKEGYIQNSKKPRDVAEKEVEEFLQVISDSSDYQFGLNHSTGYSMIGYTCAYLRYYHPLEFITAFLNCAQNTDDYNMGEELAKVKGIKINKTKFGKSGSNYTIKDGQIYKGLSSIKHINDKIAEPLNELYKQKLSFIELLSKLKEVGVNSKQLEVLIKVGYFEEYGTIYKLLTFVDYYNKINKTNFNKEKTDSEIIKYIKKYSNEINKTYKLTDKLNCLNDIWNDIPDKEFDNQILLEFQLEYLGYTDIELSYKEYLAKVLYVSVKNKSANLKSLRNNKEEWLKFKKIPKKDSIIYFTKDDIEVVRNPYNNKKDLKLINYKIVG